MSACNTAVLLFGISAFASLGLWLFERQICKRAKRMVVALQYEIECAVHDLERLRSENDYLCSLMTTNRNRP